MKPIFLSKAAILCVLLVFFSLQSQASVPPVKPETLATQLLGTWKLISYNYVGLRQTLPQDKVCLKTITSTHYSWIYYQASTNRLISTSGGSYSLADNICTEKVNYLQGAGADFRSAAYKTCFTPLNQQEEQYRAEKRMQVVLEGDVMILTGITVNGSAIEETWQRVK